MMVGSEKLNTGAGLRTVTITDRRIAYIQMMRERDFKALMDMIGANVVSDKDHMLEIAKDVDCGLLDADKWELIHRCETFGMALDIMAGGYDGEVDFAETETIAACEDCCYNECCDFDDLECRRRRMLKLE